MLQVRDMEFNTVTNLRNSIPKFAHKKHVITKRYKELTQKTTMCIISVDTDDNCDQNQTRDQ